MSCCVCGYDVCVCPRGLPGLYGGWDGKLIVDDLLLRIPTPRKPTPEVQAKLDKYKSFQLPLDRPSWDRYNMDKAISASTRSHDAQTKVGCYIVDSSNAQLGQGYNGFPRDVDDSVLPNIRPEKYPWMIHAEVNAVLNCSTKPIGATAYVTGPPCHNCLLLMWQAGIREIVHLNTPISMVSGDPDYKVLQDIMVYITKGRLKIRQME